MLVDDLVLDVELGASERLERADARRLYEGSLHEFMQAAWPLVEPDHSFVDNWHIRELCTVLEDAYYGRRRGAGAQHGVLYNPHRLLINIPPGMMKSLAVSVFFCAWAWAKNPRLRWLCFSYGAHLSTRDNLRVRDIIKSSWFQSMWPLAFSEDQDTKTRFNTEKGGWRASSSVEGMGTGEHPNFIIIDDASTALEAKSEATRSTINEWFRSTVTTRGVGDGVCVIVVGQRLHEDDLSGYLLARGGWEHVRWPMRYEKCTCDGTVICALHRSEPSWQPDPRDPRTEAGELLFPARFDEEKVRQLELDLLEDAPGQLQQRPSPEGGGLFKREHFKFAPAPPARRISCRGWDTAASEGKGDYTAGIKVSEEIEGRKDPDHPARPARLVRTGRFFIEHGVRDQLAPEGVDALMLATAQTDGRSCAVREQREGGASGKAVIAARARMLREVVADYAEVPIGVNKVLFSKPLRSQVAAGNVYIVRTGDPAQDAWIEPFIAECCSFPTGKHDDQVDAASTAYNSLGELSIPQSRGAIW